MARNGSRIRKIHQAFNVATRRHGVTAPACDGEGCSICETVSEILGYETATTPAQCTCSRLPPVFVDEHGIHYPRDLQCPVHGRLTSLHEVREDTTNGGAVRLTCVDGPGCPGEQTCLRQPWMTDSQWDHARRHFLAAHGTPDVLPATKVDSNGQTLYRVQRPWDGRYVYVTIPED